jgi:hypothetical protein
MDEIKEGWVCLANSSKYHYIRNSKSLCGKWMYLGNIFYTDECENPDDCKSYRNKLNKEKETNQGKGDVNGR